MQLDFISILIGFAGLILGFILSRYIANIRHKAEKNTLNQQLIWQKESLDKEENEKSLLLSENKLLERSLAEIEIHTEQLRMENNKQKAEMLQLQEKFEKDFKLLAQDILDKNSDTFAKQNQDTLGNIIKPLEERIKQFEKQIHDTTKEDIDRHTTLREQIKSLRDLNIQISEEAVNLTKALKGDNKIQGNWGEMILERVLEKSGLEKGREYTTQEHFDTKEGRAIPDVVVHLPDKKHIIIDSKVSLTAYERYINEEEDNLKEISLKQHIQSIENHVNQLSEKNYHNLKSVNSPGFVLLFIPIEPAFAAALNQQPNLYTKAFDKNIIIVTPTTLLATLRTIDTMWTNEKQQQNALEIARRAGALYDTFVNLTEELQKLGRQMQTTDRTYSQIMVKLTGRNNLIQRVDMLKRLGAQTTKKIDSKLLVHGNSEEEE